LLTYDRKMVKIPPIQTVKKIVKVVVNEQSRPGNAPASPAGRIPVVILSAAKNLVPRYAGGRKP
jgi:hypothetical protein